MDVDARFAATGPLGHLGLWSGMVLANRPWKMLPAFKGAIAAAFATGAYALVITTLWLLADSVGWARLLLLMVTAIVAMVAWIIVAHHLWERPEDPDQQKWAALYNGVTVLTVTSAVLCAYAILFALIFAGGVGVRAGHLLPDHPQAPGGLRGVPDALLACGLPGNGRGSLGGQPGGRGNGARGILRLPAATTPRKRRRRDTVATRTS